MEVKIADSWKEILQSEFDKDYFVKLTQFVKAEYASGRCYPPGNEIFNAFSLCPLEKVKVVLLGQDPYHEPGHNIFKEVKEDVGSVPEFSEVAAQSGQRMYNGSLRRWAEQGVLLLNATLTVREHQAGSHQRQGWETFTDAVIKAVSDTQEHVVFILWGGYARSKKYLINKQKHLILESVHPSPLSANRGGWFGNHHFSQCNAYLEQHGKEKINW